jgi:hypothetical protein
MFMYLLVITELTVKIQQIWKNISDVSHVRLLSKDRLVQCTKQYILLLYNKWYNEQEMRQRKEVKRDLPIEGRRWKWNFNKI